jgi:hypothetical protein
MLDRLLSIQPQEFHRKIVPFVNDVTVGWDISEISKSEVSEFMTIVIKKLAEQDIAIPEQIWNSWMYVLGFDDDKGRFKSLKDFGKMNIENRMESVEKLLDESKDLILGFQDKEHIDGLYCFLLDSTRNCSDVYLLLNRFISLPSRLCGRNAWHKFLAKLLYYKDSSIDLVLDLVYRMMVLENVIPTTELILMLKKYMLKNQTRGLSPSGADILNRLDSKNELYNVMLGTL